MEAQCTSPILHHCSLDTEALNFSGALQTSRGERLEELAYQDHRCQTYKYYSMTFILIYLLMTVKQKFIALNFVFSLVYFTPCNIISSEWYHSTFQYL